MKESMSERNSNPKYFSRIMCDVDGCKETHNLLFHHYNETFMCEDHVNEALAQAALEDEENQKYDDYRDLSYNQLLQERNA